MTHLWTKPCLQNRENPREKGGARGIDIWDQVAKARRLLSS